MQLYNIIQADFIGLSFEDKISYLNKFTKKSLKVLNEDIAEYYGHNFTKEDLIKSIISLYVDKDLIKHFK
jgi:uncharacterized UPF0146 family protein